MAFLLLWGDTIEMIVRAADARFHAASIENAPPGGWLVAVGEWLNSHPTQGPLVYYGLKLGGLAIILAGGASGPSAACGTPSPCATATSPKASSRCRLQKVRVRELLVWRTGGTMINGAVLGVLGSTRYILLTNTLLDILPNHCVQAVMAHEIGHVRCKHVPWLTATLFAASGTALVAMNIALKLALGMDLNHIDPTLQLRPLSRRSRVRHRRVRLRQPGEFEWQADAFAAKHFSIHTPPTDDPTAAWSPSPTVTRPSIAAMCAASEIVATANHLPAAASPSATAPSATRINKLLSLEGRDLKRLQIDAASSRLKLAIALACIVVLISALGYF